MTSGSGENRHSDWDVNVVAVRCLGGRRLGAMPPTLQNTHSPWLYRMKDVAATLSAQNDSLNWDILAVLGGLKLAAVQRSGLIK